MEREVLPIPDKHFAGLTTYDAKDPDTSFPPIEPVRPPQGAPNVLVVLLDDVGFGASSTFGGRDRHAERRPARRGRTEVQPLPHHGAVLADPRGAAQRPQPPHGRHGRHHRDRHLGPGLLLAAPERLRAARRDPQAQRLLDRAVRQVPRGPGVGDEPDGPVRELADRQRLRVLLRLHRRRGAPVLPGDLRGDDAGRAVGHARGGLPPHGRHDRQGDQLGPLPEVADARQAVLRLLRPGRDARAAPRPAGLGGSLQGPLRRRLGRAPRGDLRAPEGARRDPGRRAADAAPRRDPGVGRDARGPQAGPAPADGGLRGLPRVHRPPRRPPVRRARGPRGVRQHARLLHHRRQRRLGGGHAERHVQRDDQLQRRRRDRDAGVHDGAARRLRRAGLLQPLRGGLGARDGHALPVDEAGGFALRRHPQRHRRPLARRASPRRARSGPSSRT